MAKVSRRTPIERNLEKMARRIEQLELALAQSPAGTTAGTSETFQIHGGYGTEYNASTLGVDVEFDFGTGPLGPLVNPPTPTVTVPPGLWSLNAQVDVEWSLATGLTVPQEGHIAARMRPDTVMSNFRPVERSIWRPGPFSHDNKFTDTLCLSRVAEFGANTDVWLDIDFVLLDAPPRFRIRGLLELTSLPL